MIGRFPGETSALCLIWAVLELSSRGWRGVIMTPKTVAEIERIRRQQTDTSTNTTEEVTPPNIPDQRSYAHPLSPGRPDAAPGRTGVVGVLFPRP